MARTAPTPSRGCPTWLAAVGVAAAAGALLVAAARPHAQTPAPAAPPCAELAARVNALFTLAIPEWRHQAGEVPVGPDRPTFDDASWARLRAGDRLPGGTGWLRANVEVPAALGGYPTSGTRARLRLPLDAVSGGRLSLFVNGVGIDGAGYLDSVVVADAVLPGTRLSIAVQVSQSAGGGMLRDARLELDPPAGRPDPRVLAVECQVAGAAMGIDAGAGPARPELAARAAAAVNWAALDQGQQDGFDASIREARAVLEPVRAWLRHYRILAVGNARIDMAWLRPWSETVERTRETFTDVLRLMREYPDVTFTHASAQAYAWIEDDYPALFDEIRRRVKEGRWEVVGGMWVEPDLNLTDGEPLVRQLLVGTRYLKEKLGVDVRVAWSPDSSGYNWQLPQIFRKSGLDYLVTPRLFGNDTTAFPHRIFWWEGLDGSRLLTYVPGGYGNDLDPVRMAQDLGAYAAATGLPELAHLYGVGDHGGATRQMIETARQWAATDRAYPRVAFGTMQAFFDGVEKRLPSLKLPTWKDELYLGNHYGAFTSQAQIKQQNRQNEALLLTAERFAAMDAMDGRAYPVEDLAACWRSLLANQSRDLLPGAGIGARYRDAARDHAEIRRRAGALLSEAAESLAARANTQGAGIPVVVFNPLTWTRTDVVEATVDRPGDGLPAIQVQDSAGRPVPSEVIAPSVTGPLTVRFLADRVPSAGYKVFHVVPMATAPPVPSMVRTNGLTIENEFLRATVDAATGCLASVFDKVARREVVATGGGGCANALQVFTDAPTAWDAWNIDADFERDTVEITRADEVTVTAKGPLRATIHVVRRYQSSTFRQDYTLTAGIPRLEMATEVDWHEHHKLVKAAFPLAVRSETATYEVPFGSIARPTTRRTPAEQAKFEVPAIRWADVSDASWGVSLLNDGKYGYDTKDNVIRLSLLRAPTWPDPEADQGMHRFTYALHPHQGGWADAETVRQGYGLNTPLVPIVTTSHAGRWPEVRALVSVEPRNVMVSAVKRAEDGGGGLVVRLYEWAGRDGSVRLRLPRPAVSAAETNLMEKGGRELKLDRGDVVCPIARYEIKTIIVRFAP
jgi:alpha-mannosidase